jgi:hypothetical protein
MNVNLEVKGTLAKLLATEDLMVEHRQIETAQFDVDTRVLTLPIWDTTNTVFDVLVSHEVGHALFTPNEDWTHKCTAPQTFVNVCEDVRVEKLMKRKYMGIGKTFYRGYKELHEMDFFEVDDLDTYNLADKINLHFKVGAFLGIKFTPQEQVLVNVVENAETFEEALAAAEALHTYCKSGEEETHSIEGDWMDQLEDSKDSNDINTSNSTDNNAPISDTDSDDAVEDRSDSLINDPPLSPPDGPVVSTMEKLNEKVKELAKPQRIQGYTYVERPKFPQKMIVKNEEISDSCEEFWNMIYAEPLNKTHYLDPIDDALIQYKRSAEKEINYLVKEFECRKSADAYARASTARTGVLDTTKLHTYKYNEDLFRKVTSLPDGKNHGLIFLLDWSGSMCNQMGSTIKQLLNLVWFCKKVQIPFRVYGFTNCYFLDDDSYGRNYDHLTEPKYNEVWIDKSFRLLEFLSSEGNTKQFERQIQNFWRIGQSLSRDADGQRCDIPQRFNLSGTPLNLALLSLHDVIPAFKNKYDLQKVQTVVLTDGESEPIGYAAMTENPRTLDRKLFRRDGRFYDLYLRDRKLGTTYHLKDWISQTANIVKNLQDNFPEVNFIGIRLTPNSDFRKMLNWWGLNNEKVHERWRKEKSVALDLGNFTKFFALSVNEMKKDVEFEVDEDATKAQIRSAFKKSLNKSKFNRKILSEFVELVA